MPEDTFGLNELADWITVVAAPLTLIGLALGWVQLRRTQRATVAAQVAVTRTARNLALYQVLVLIPVMQQVETALDDALSDSSADKAREALSLWRRTGSEVRGLLESRTPQQQLMTALQSSFAAAYLAKERLARMSVEDATGDFRRSMGEVTIMLGTLAGQLRANIGGTE